MCKFGANMSNLKEMLGEKIFTPKSNFSLDLINGILYKYVLRTYPG